MDVDGLMKHAWHLALIACVAGCAGSPVEAQRSRVEMDTHALRGEIALEAERLDEAANHFLSAARLADDPSLAERATRIAYDAGLQDIGLDAVRRWLEIDPEDVRAHWFAGIFEARSGRIDAAVDHFDEFVATGAERGGAGMALGLIVEALAAEPDTQLGVVVLGELIERHPGTPEGHFGLARLALRAGNFPLALENARRATELRP